MAYVRDYEDGSCLLDLRAERLFAEQVAAKAEEVKRLCEQLHQGFYEGGLPVEGTGGLFPDMLGGHDFRKVVYNRSFELAELLVKLLKELKDNTEY